MDTSILKFCPKCNALFSYTGIDKLQLSCKGCGYVHNPDDDSSSSKAVVHVKFVQESETGVSAYALPKADTVHDQTMFRTTKVQCPGPKGEGSCPSQDPKNWQMDGTGLPVTYLFNQPDESRIMYMMCTACHTSWKISNAAAHDEDEADAEGGEGEEA